MVLAIGWDRSEAGWIAVILRAAVIILVETLSGPDLLSSDDYLGHRHSSSTGSPLSVAVVYRTSRKHHERSVPEYSMQDDRQIDDAH